MKRHAQSIAVSLVVVAVLSDAAGGRAEGIGGAAETAQAIYQTLRDRGVTPALIYDAEGFGDISGGARRGATYLDNLSLQLTFDMQRLVGWPGATIFLYGLGIHGGQPSDFAGDAQGVSSIAAPSKWTLEEAWLEQNLLGDRCSVLIGRYDLNTEFYRLHAADLFLNASFGIGPEFSLSGKAGPSVFPNTSLGARFAVKPFAGLALRTAVLDGVPVERANGWDAFAKGDGVLIVNEAALLYRPPSDGPQPRLPHRFLLGREAQLSPYDAKLAVGVWQYTASFPDLNRAHGDGTPVVHHGSTGAYVIGDAIVYRDDGGRHIRVFGQLGVGDPRVNRFGLYTGGGVDLVGVVPGRAKDEIGFGVAAAHNGDEFIRQQRKMGQQVNRSEATIELAYRAPIASWLNIQPDLQYVFNPNTDPRVPNALIGLIRVELAF